MESIKEKFLVDEKGERIGVFIEMDDYRKILEELEELDEIRAFDEAMASGEESIPFEQAVTEIESRRRNV